MHVVLDTNAWGKPSPALSNAHVDRLIAAASSAGYVVFVPEVVVLEREAHLREQCKASLHRLREAANVLRSWSDVHPLTDADWDTLVDQHVKKFRQSLEAADVRIYPLPQVPHGKLLERDLVRRKPFDAEGRGYRDALIWETILEMLPGSDNQVVFVTGNSSDFGKSSLDSALQDDVNHHGQFSDQVTLVESAFEFMRRFVFQHDARAEALIGHDVASRFDGLQFKIEDAIADDLARFKDVDELVGVPIGAAKVLLDNVQIMKMGVIEGAMQMNGAEQYISFAAEAEIDAQGTGALPAGASVDVQGVVRISFEAELYVDTLRGKVSQAFTQAHRVISVDDETLGFLLDLART